MALAREVLERTWASVGRARAEAAMVRSEGRYRSIVEGADDFAIVTLDEAGIITGWNSGAERVLGWAREEAVGRQSDLFFTPEDRAEGVPDREINRAASTGRAVDERWHVKRDGARFWGSGLTMRLGGPGDGYLKMFRDRTLEHEAEAALRESERQVAGVLDGMGEGFVLLDREFRIRRINAEGLRIDGRSASEIVGRSHWEAWPGSEAGVQGRLYKRLMREGQAGSIEVRYAWLDRELWFEIRAYPVSEGLAIFYRDITGRKRANARREAQSQLADRLRDVRTPADAAFAASEVLGKTLEAGRVG